jgi:hypothetical protein
MSVSVQHVLDESLLISVGDVEIVRYSYAPDLDAREVPKPYFHPLRSLAGDVVTLARPTDHLWHHGLSLTFANLSEANFWGGATYVRGEGYKVLDNFGRIRHDAFETIERGERDARFVERLSWIGPDERTWLSERREVSCSIGSAEVDGWILQFDTSLRNTSGRVLEFGSPTTEGRPQAGYGGLFWRGPRSFLDGTVRTDSGYEGSEAMGATATWLAFEGQHDETGNFSTLVFVDRPSNPRYPTKWFIRNNPIACASFAFMFDEVYELQAEGTLTLSYRLYILNGTRTRDQIEALL